MMMFAREGLEDASSWLAKLCSRAGRVHRVTCAAGTQQAHGSSLRVLSHDHGTRQRETLSGWGCRRTKPVKHLCAELSDLCPSASNPEAVWVHCSLQETPGIPHSCSRFLNVKFWHWKSAGDLCAISWRTKQFWATPDTLSVKGFLA